MSNHHAKPAGAVKPVPKIAAAGTAGAMALVLTWLVSMTGIEIPAEVASAITLLITAGAGWLTPDRGGVTR